MRNVRVVTASYAILMALPVMFGLGIVAGSPHFLAACQQHPCRGDRLREIA